MFERLKHDSTLVKNLKDEKWWLKLVELSHTDRDINIQIRPKSINVYSKMGNLLRISLNKGKVICEVHYKFLIAALKPPYVKISPEGGFLNVGKDVCPSVNDILSENSLKVIKQNIAKYSGEEKTIQSKLVEINKSTILINPKLPIVGIIGHRTKFLFTFSQLFFFHFMFGNVGGNGSGTEYVPIFVKNWKSFHQADGIFTTK